MVLWGWQHNNKAAAIKRGIERDYVVKRNASHCYCTVAASAFIAFGTEINRETICVNYPTIIELEFQNPQEKKVYLIQRPGPCIFLLIPQFQQVVQAGCKLLRANCESKYQHCWAKWTSKIVPRVLSGFISYSDWVNNSQREKRRLNVRCHWKHHTKLWCCCTLSYI